MASGIYLLGQSKDVGSAFDDYIQPQLNERGVVVFDRSLVPFDMDKKGLLVSLTGESLEEMLSQGIVSAFDIARAGYTKAAGIENTWEFGLGLIETKSYVPERVFQAKYKTISSYTDSEAATREFPLRVQQYLLERLSALSEQVSEEILGLMERTLADFAK